VFVVAFLVALTADLQALVFGGPMIMRLEWAAGLAALMAVAYVILGQDRDLRRNFASFEQYAQYSRAVWTGDIPPELESELWRLRLRTNRRSNLLRALYACYLVAVGVLSLSTHQSVHQWVIAALLQAVAIWLLIKWWDTRQHLRSLAAKVERYAIRETFG
jgi:protein-S-isoprenylcysteine O-methyltransferase Ste14